MKPKKTVWTEQRLQTQFRLYDLMFFDGRLSDWTVLAKEPFPRGTASGTPVLFVGFTDEWKKQILVSPVTLGISKDSRIKSVLLHEMAHAASGDGTHGKTGAWGQEMNRLKAARAPVGRLSFSCKASSNQKTPK